MSDTALGSERRVKVHTEAICRTCRQRHRIDNDPRGFQAAAWEWHAKHPPDTCDTEFVSDYRRLPKGIDESRYTSDVPWWLQYKENANIKVAYAASASLTITLASLGSSSTFIAGRESAVVNNTGSNYIDYRIAGKITTGTSPTTAKSIRIYAYAAIDDVPTYPTNFDGTDSAVTVTSVESLAQIAYLGGSPTEATSNRTYWFNRLATISTVYGFVPQYWGIFVCHDTAVNLNSTGSNHALTNTGMYMTVI